MTRVKRWAIAGLIAVVGMLTSLTWVAPALAGFRGDVQKFNECPEGYRLECLYSKTTSGLFKLGKSEVPIVNPVVIQGGIGGGGKLVAAKNGETLSKTKEPVPGGLTGLGIPGSEEEVNSVAELAGQAYVTGEALIPLKAHLENPSLGESCYIGSDAEPISLDLNYRKGMETSYQDHAILTVHGTLEDTTFKAPGATGCDEPAGDSIIDGKEGLPAESGNKAEQTGSTEEVPHRLVLAVEPLPDFGHCVKVTPEIVGKETKYNGGYSDSKCTITAFEFNQKYEWTPGPGSSPTFSGVSTAVKLQSAGGAVSIKCTASHNAGEYTGQKTETDTITLTGCAAGSSPCQSSGAASGEVVSDLLEGSLDFIKETASLEYEPKSVIGLELKAASGTELFSFECGGTGYSVSGAQIGAIGPTDTNTSVFKVTDKETGGVPQYTKFEETPTPTTLMVSKGGGSAEAAGMQIAQSQTGTETHDVKGDVR